MATCKAPSAVSAAVLAAALLVSGCGGGSTTEQLAGDGGGERRDPRPPTPRINAEALQEATKLYDGIRMRSTKDNANRRDFMWDQTSNLDLYPRAVALWGAGNDSKTTFEQDTENQVDIELAGWRRIALKPENPDVKDTYHVHLYGRINFDGRFGYTPPLTFKDEPFKDKWSDDLNDDAEKSLKGSALAEQDGNYPSPIRIPGYDVPTVANVKEVPNRLRGFFDEVPGTYVCSTDLTARCAMKVKTDPGTTGLRDPKTLKEPWNTRNYIQLGSLDGDNAFTSATDSTWKFVPDDPDFVTPILIMGGDDERRRLSFYSYGWWLRTTADGTQTGSAFYDYKTADDGISSYIPLNSQIQIIEGTARYEGGAAGLYALKGASGRESESGHFTADVSLTAEFFADTIKKTGDNVTGMVRNFKVGKIGEEATEARPSWSVELMKTPILEGPPYSAANPSSQTNLAAAIAAGVGKIMGDGSNTTEWIIDGTAAPPSGDWDGQLYDTFITTDAQDRTEVPKYVLGQFYTEYTHSDVGTGKMVGAFGVDRKDKPPGSQ